MFHLLGDQLILDDMSNSKNKIFNFNHLKNNRVDMTQQFSHLSDSDSQSACRFEGGE